MTHKSESGEVALFPSGIQRWEAPEGTNQVEVFTGTMRFFTDIMHLPLMLHQ